MHFGKQIMQWFFRPQCVKCRKFGSWICDGCKNKLIGQLPECYVCRKISPNFETHHHCKSIETPFDKVIICWQYDTIARQLISRYKYLYTYQIAETIATLIAQSTTFTKIQACTSPDFDTILTTIPLHRNRFNQRGFNQCDLIIQKLITDFPPDHKIAYIPDLIKRKSSSHHQAHLDRFERRERIKGVFEINKRNLTKIKSRHFDPKQIIIFDDILTTGSTLNEAASTIASTFPTALLTGFCIWRGKNRYKTK